MSIKFYSKYFIYTGLRVVNSINCGWSSHLNLSHPHSEMRKEINCGKFRLQTNIGKEVLHLPTMTPWQGPWIAFRIIGFMLYEITGDGWITMMTSSNGNIFRVTGPLCGEFTGPGEFPTQRPVTRSFEVFFDLRLNKRLSKQPWGWWFETLSWSLWCQCNVPSQRSNNVDAMASQLFSTMALSQPILAYYQLDYCQTNFGEISNKVQ